MLEAHSLTKRYGDATALNALTLRVDNGEVYGLLGANGAGKTTTIHLFLNFIEPNQGQALIDGLDVGLHAQATKRLCAYIPETVMLYPSLTGLENLDYFTTLALGHTCSKAQLLDWLAQAGLQAEAANKPVSAYSKGMRQKVGIAIALAKGATSLLLDEPTSGLDPQAAHEFALLLRQLADKGVAILMATHDLFLAKETCTKIGIMKKGQLMSELMPKDLGISDLERLYLDIMRAA
jgi:ABC-2 type transport system ATP-binding protein